MESMTGYGTATGPVGQGRLTIEIKTLNHRYCEFSFRLPARMGVLEGRLRPLLQAKLQRGKVEVFAKELEPILGGELQLNVRLAKEYQKGLRRLQKELKIEGPPNPIAWMGLSPFLQWREQETDTLHFYPAIERLVLKALRSVLKMRGREGRFLLQDQKKRLRAFDRCLQRIARRDQRNWRQRQKKTVVHSLENNTSAKNDIQEELTRLRSHAQQYHQALRSQGPVGRRLDFLIQEMHREMNTIGAKAADAVIAQAIVQGKTLLENLREQVQNIL